MNVALITKSKRQINLKLFDEHLKVITEEEFQDTYTLNFFLQTIPKKYNINKTLIIFNDLEKLSPTNQINNNTTIELLLAEEENEYFIGTISAANN
jgi:hypothetical protein